MFCLDCEARQNAWIVRKFKMQPLILMQFQDRPARVTLEYSFFRICFRCNLKAGLQGANSRVVTCLSES